MSIDPDLLEALRDSARESRLLRRDIHQLAAALRRGERQEEQLVTTIADAVTQFKADADEIATDDAAVTASVAAGVKAMSDLEAALSTVALSADEETAVSAALAELGKAHTDLGASASSLSAAAATAEGDVPAPPAPPAP
jgi:hypothetical protein